MRPCSHMAESYSIGADGRAPRAAVYPGPLLSLTG